MNKSKKEKNTPDLFNFCKSKLLKLKKNSRKDNYNKKKIKGKIYIMQTFKNLKIKNLEFR